MTVMLDECRKAFERKLLELEPNANLDYAANYYTSKFTEFDWQMWQAAWKHKPTVMAEQPFTLQSMIMDALRQHPEGKWVKLDGKARRVGDSLQLEYLNAVREYEVDASTVMADRETAERVAIAISPWRNDKKCDETLDWQNTPEHIKQAYREQAKAAIAAMGGHSDGGRIDASASLAPSPTILPTRLHHADEAGPQITGSDFKKIECSEIRLSKHAIAKMIEAIANIIESHRIGEAPLSPKEDANYIFERHYRPHLRQHAPVSLERCAIALFGGEEHWKGKYTTDENREWCRTKAKAVLKEANVSYV